MRRFLAPVFALAREPHTREFLAFCLPALLLGLALRVTLMVHLPHAFYHDDASDFLCTPDRLLHEHKWEIHQKKTFLVPILFTVPFLVGAPALIAIPVLQHILGLAFIVLVGLLCRLWFTHWRWLIIPVTLLIALNPFLLWYEHTIMAETVFIFCTLLVALAGTLYALSPTRRRFIFLAVALFLEAGARPEGKLLFVFAFLLLALVHAGSWRSEWRRFATLLALGAVAHLTTRTSQAGLLLYTSVVKMTPPELRCAPGFEPYIAPIRDDLRQRWAQKPNFPRVRDRRLVSAAVERYLKENPGVVKVEKHGDVNGFCARLAFETCLRNLSSLPGHTVHKFRFVATESPAMRYDNAAFFDKQREAYSEQSERVLRLSPALLGRTLSSDAELQHFIETTYGEVPWFNALSDRWLAVVNAWRFRDERFSDLPNIAFVYHGVPFYFAAGALGLLVAMFRRGELQRFHFAWGLALACFFFVIIITANVRPRFRIVFEPFWFIYLAMLADTALVTVRALRSK